MNDPERCRIEFRIGAAFDPRSRVARYVMRLSIALGDLRIAGRLLGREEQPAHERMYFVRVVAAHLHELCILFQPSDDTIPTIEQFIVAIRPEAAVETNLRKAHRRVLKALKKTTKTPGRPDLSSELSRLRNGFAHYAYRQDADTLLMEAMTLAADQQSAYVIRGRTMRAEYADEVSQKLMHPWSDLTDDDWQAATRALHARIKGLLAAVSDYMHQAETAYLATRPRGVVRRIEMP